MYSFSYLEPVCCSMSCSNYCFLTCIQISQEVGEVVWYPHLFKNFPEFVVVHTIKGFGIVSKAEVDIFLGLSCFFNDPMDVGDLISGEQGVWLPHLQSCSTHPNGWGSPSPGRKELGLKVSLIFEFLIPIWELHCPHS